MSTKVLVVDDCVELTDEIVSCLSKVEGIDIVGVCDNGIMALESINLLKPDIILLDIVMPLLDGFGVLERMDKSKTKVIILSALSQDVYISKAMKMGAHYYMIKPFNVNSLMNIVTEFAGTIVKPVSEISNRVSDGRTNEGSKIRLNSERPGYSKTMEEKIANIFMTVGIPAHIKGYQFLREAIKIAVDNPDIINSITKKLYPSIADRFETTSSKVERAIRHAIEVAWNRGKIENINILFGVKVYNTNEKPTNGEFIALVADKMLIEGA